LCAIAHSKSRNQIISSHDTYEQRLERTRKIRDDIERVLKRCAANADIA